MTWKVLELLNSGYSTRAVAQILEIPFEIVLKIETENTASAAHNLAK